MPDDPPALALARAWGVRCRELDLRCVQRCNRVLLRRGMPLLLRWVSRLGDGLLWYPLIALLPLVAGARGWECARLMLIVGVINLLLYWALKFTTARERPIARCADLTHCTHALDRYSFPSGHTLHAVGFGIVVASYFPAAAPVLAPFAVLTGWARVALGLHYPSDTVVGALLGGAVALGVLNGMS